MDRRTFLASGLAAAGFLPRRAAAEPAPTRFQIACMTLPFSRFPLARALDGIKGAGYRFVAWGTTHDEGDGRATPVMPKDAEPARARELGRRCRDLGLEPVMMFCGTYTPPGND